MLRKFLKFLGLYKPSVRSLKSDSANIVSVFTKTVDKLSLVNQQIQLAISTREAKLAAIEAERSLLQEQVNGNSNVMTKINQLFHPTPETN